MARENTNKICRCCRTGQISGQFGTTDPAGIGCQPPREQKYDVVSTSEPWLAGVPISQSIPRLGTGRGRGCAGERGSGVGRTWGWIASGSQHSLRGA